MTFTYTDVLVNVTNTRVPVNVESCNVFIAKSSSAKNLNPSRVQYYEKIYSKAEMIKS